MILAKRIPPRQLPLPTTTVQKAGLRYERRVVRALRNRGCDLEHNPWFEYNGNRHCCPDVVIYELNLNRAIVIEIKTTVSSMGLEKLLDLYCPVVASATKLRAVPLMIAKHSNPSLAYDFPLARTFWQVVDSSEPPIYLWPGNGPIT